MRDPKQPGPYNWRMPATLTYDEKVRRLPFAAASTALNSFFALMTFGSSVFVLYLGKLGLDTGRIGLMMSLLPFCGLIAIPAAHGIARFGLKRTYLTFYGARKVVLLSLLLTPWLLARYGLGTTSVFIAVVIGVFAICRALAETAFLPWAQEYVPNAIRGRFGAIRNILGQAAGVCAALIAGYVLTQSAQRSPDGSADLRAYMLLLAVGCAVGLGAVALASFIPGGAPALDEHDHRSHFRGVWRAARDRRFVLFMAGAGCAMLAYLPLHTFVPLFMRRHVGLTDGQVVYLEPARLLGGILTLYIWGMAADRRGGKPVILAALSLMAVAPVVWMIMPRQSAFSLPVAMACGFVYGAALAGTQTGMAICLYNTIVPPDKKTGYMALYYAWIGIVGGAGPIAGGMLLKRLDGLSGNLGPLRVDTYTPLFMASLALMVGAVLLVRRIRQ